MNKRLSRALLALALGLGYGIPSQLQAAEGSESINQLTLFAGEAKEVINRNIYGHFSEHLGRCIYEGYWVGETSSIPNVRGIRQDVVKALKNIQIPVLRWPGGCFADEYHWNDGIGPRQDRPSMINTHWGGVTENNHFGTHEFLDLCEQLGCEPYICGNLGSGTVREMQEWVEYITFDGVSPMTELRKKNGREKPWKLKYFGVGNENWGCGGNMTPDYYADQYKRYATYVRDFSGNRIFKIACGPNGGDTNWTAVVMREAGRRMNALALHYYTTIPRNRSATLFFEAEWFRMMKNAQRMDDLIKAHTAVMDKFDPQKRVALIVDEWGTWHSVEPGTNPGFLYQQNTLRDALVAGLSLNIFNQHCDRVKMANIAQTINVLQAMILTDGPRMILTPTYHVYEMYKVHHEAKMVPVKLQCKDYRFEQEGIPGLSVSASKDKNGKVHLTMCNLDPNQAAELDAVVKDAKFAKIGGRVLTASTMAAHNTFDKPETLKPVEFTACKLTENGFSATLPAKSVVALELE